MGLAWGKCVFCSRGWAVSPAEALLEEELLELGLGEGELLLLLEEELLLELLLGV